MEPILGFSGTKYRFMSNFYYSDVFYDGLLFKTSEHAYQAAKTLILEERKYIQSLSSPGDAKEEGSERAKKITLRRDWNKVKIKIMTEIVAAKFNQNPKIMKQLLETGQRQLVETNTWHDNFWGDCVCIECRNKIGHNHLGIILMNVRGGIYI